MSYIQSAFNAICRFANPAEHCFVCLIAECPAYGGPEEGGWWYTISELVAYEQFPSVNAAQAAAERITTLAQELQHQEAREYGEHCLRSLDWLEERGLEPDFLPEPDGPTEYKVEVCQELPTFDNRKPQYC